MVSYEPFDSNSELWMDYLERFRTFLIANSILKEREAQVFLTNQTRVTYKLLSYMVGQPSPAKGINNLSKDVIQMFMGE